MNLTRHFKNPWIQLIVLVVLALAVITFITMSGLLDQPLDLEKKETTEVIGRTDLPDFRSYDNSEARKAAFFDFLRPIIQAENRGIRQIRERLKEIAATLRKEGEIEEADQKWLRNLALRYRIDMHRHDTRGAVVKILLRRVDVIPESLILVQAAKESAWGTSRFAHEGNNLFGQWCFTKGCGMVPTQRTSGKTHEVETFQSVRAAVASYMRNLNSHPAYAELRAIRHQRRQAGQPLTGYALAGGLIRYSEQGEKYVREVRTMIERNELGEGTRES